LRKLDKILKKEREEMENVAGTGAANARLVYDKILKSL